jgi:hypothetical protein
MKEKKVWFFMDLQKNKGVPASTDDIHTACFVYANDTIIIGLFYETFY